MNFRLLDALAGRCAVATFLLVAAASGPWLTTSAQEPPKPMPAAAPMPPAGQATYADLIKRAPYDVITTTKAAGGEVRHVVPVPRPLPEMPKPSDKLVVQMLVGDEKYEIKWFDIERIDLFEQIILSEANQLVTAGKLDEAFDYFRYLYEFYPKTAGLPQSHQQYLYQCIADARKRDDYHEALAVAEELYDKNNSFKAAENSPPILEEIGQIADRLLDAYVKKDDFRSAKSLLKRLQSRYGVGTSFVRAWRLKLSEIAAGHRDRAAQHLAAEKFVEAYDACAAMINVWPEVEGGAALAAEVARRYPLAMVGVAQPAIGHDPRDLSDPAARRTGPLLERRLMEFAGMGPEGGVYRSALGDFQQSDDRLELTFQLKKAADSSAASAYTGFDVARHLLELADPASSQYQPQWARLLKQVEVRGVGRVDVTLKVPHVLPQALLQTSYDPTDNLGAAGVKGSGPYFVLLKSDKLARYTKNDRYPLFTPGQPAEIMERFYDDPKRGLLALQRAEVDVLDRVFPGDVPELQRNSDISIGRYSVPTTHFLTIVRRHPYLANRTFRRALIYGINRKAILETSLLRLQKDATPPPGYREISAPFPAPINASDATAYGYDNAIEPRPYNPWLSVILKTVAGNELKAQFESQQKQAPPLSPLTLGHPADEICRIACRAMAQQWKAIGIQVNLVEFPPGVVADLKNECDLVYTRGMTWEPIVDASRLLAPGGLAPADNTYVSLMLRRVESARDWVEARQALRDLHRQLHEDVAVIPLWQTFDYYAWRHSLLGIKDGQVSLYETVDQWRVAPRLEAK